MDTGDDAARVAEVFERAAIATARRAICGAGQAVCIDCDAPIDAARRKAYPAARRCLYCQQLCEAAARRL